jgi:hypothetical protein
MLSQSSGISVKAYEQFFQKVQNTLDIKFSQDIGSIAIKLGVEDLISPAQKLLQTFKVMHTRGMYSATLFASIAFFVHCSQRIASIPSGPTTPQILVALLTTLLRYF